MSASDRYAVIGHPVAHSLSPRIHALFAAQTQQRLTYVALDALPERLESSTREFFALGGLGMNVTVPHKEAVLALLQSLSARAERAGAVNTIVRREDASLFGDNTDGVGLVSDLTQNLRLSLRACRILLLGAGGAARGVIGPLLEQSPAELVITNRTATRAQALAQTWTGSGCVRALALDELGDSSFDLIVNATPASAAAPRIDARTLRLSSVCYDMAYGRASGFAEWARRAGAQHIYDGLGMLVEQAAEAFTLWRGVRPLTQPVLAALRTQSALPCQQAEREAR